MELPDAHNACVFCLGRAHTEAALDGPDCPACEEMTVKVLHARISVILNCAPANSLPLPPVVIEPRKERQRQPHAVGLSDEHMLLIAQESRLYLYPAKNRLDMRYLQSGRQVAAPSHPLPFSLRSTRRSRGLGAPPIRPESKPQDRVCYPLSMEPTARRGNSCSTSLSICTWVEICAIASIKAVPHHESHHRKGLYGNRPSSIRDAHYGDAANAG